MPTEAAITAEQLTLFAEFVPTGGGNYRLVPAKASGPELAPRLAAKFLGVSRSTIYRLIDEGYLTCRRPSPRKLLISVESLKKHRAASEDPDFWSGFKK